MISILYVDDETTLLEVTKIYMEQTGEFTIDTCTSAKEAIEKLNAHFYDAVVSDYQMPEMDGIEFLKYLRPKYGTLPFILFTGRGREEVAIEALNSGADFYLQKGGEPKSQFAELKNKIQQAVKRRQAEAALVKSEEKYRDLVENINDVLFIVDTSWTITYISPMVSQFGYTPGQMVGKPLTDFVIPDAMSDLKGQFEEMKQGAKPSECKIRDGSGKMRWIRISSHPVFEREQFIGLRGIVTDITGQNEMQDALRVSEEHYRGIFDNAPIGIFHSTPEGDLIDVNPVFARMFGYGSPGEMIAAVNRTGIAEAHYVDPRQRAAIVRSVLESREWRTVEIPFRRRDGSIFQSLLSIRSTANHTSGMQEMEGFVLDISESKKAEARIVAVERRYHNIFDAAGDAMLVLDNSTGEILDANPAAIRMYGFSRDELKERHHDDLFAEKSEDPGAGGAPFQPLIYYRRKDGTVFAAETTSSNYPQKRRSIRIVSIRDITDRKKAEERVIAAQRLYAVLSQISQSIVRVQDLETLLADICRISVDYGKFRMVWVGLVDHESGIIRPVAHSGFEDGYLSAIDISIADNATGSGPAGRAIREGTYVICNTIGEDPQMKPWRTEALKRGYRSSAAFPISLHGAVVGAISIYAEEPEFFNETEVQLLDEIARDVSFALDMLDEQARRTRAEKALAGSEERAKFLAGVLELSSQPFAVGLPDGSIGIVNPAFCELVGYTESELHSLTWTAITPPDYQEGEMAALRELSRTGVPQRYEKEYLRKDGTRVPVEMFVHGVTDSGNNIQYYYAFITDISERKRAEAILKAERDRMQQYLDVAGVMLAVMDREGTVTLINRKGCAILGYTEEEILGRNWFDTFLPEALRSDVKGVFNRIMNGDLASVEYYENPVLTKSGGERIIAFHNTILTGPDGITGVLFSGEDITIQKRTEDALRGSEERFRNLIQNSSDMIRIIDRNGRILYSSPSTLRIVGYDPSELIGRDPLDYIHPDDRERVRSAIGEVFSGTNSGIPTEFRIQHADGHYVDVEATAMNLLGVPGIDGIVTTTRPITERKKAEQALRDSEERYRTIFESSTDAILLMSDDVLDYNPETERMLGLTLGEIIGHRLEDFSPPLQPDGRNSKDALSACIHEALEGKPRFFPWVFLKKDGSRIEAEVSLQAVVVGDERRLIVLIRDITGLNRAAVQIRRLASFPSLNPDPVIEFSLKKEVTYANPAAYAALRKLGMPENPAAFLPEDADRIVESSKAGRPEALYREVMVGDGLYGETVTYAPDFGAIRIYAHDITNRVRETDALEQANRKLHLLTSITRHDIKNKLTGVLGYLELSLGSTDNPALLEYLKRAETSANAIRQQIEFTKEYEELGIKAPGWYTVTPLVGEIRKQLDLGTVAVEDETDGLRIYADSMFSKVIYNLMDNSLRHGGRTSRIRFSIRTSAENCTLVYEDDGVGIPAGDKEKIFNRVPKRNDGIGLFLVREVLSITGITIKETGEPGKGARFEISIPRGKFQMNFIN